MSVRILIKRHISEGDHPKLTELLHKMRSLTLKQPGYIVGQPLQRVVEGWNDWFWSPDRNAVQAGIGELLGQATEYAVYEYL